MTVGDEKSRCRRERRRELARGEAAEILDAFVSLPLEIRPSTVLLAPAFDIAAGLDRTVYDSLYLALAIAEDCVLATADAKFHEIVAASPLASHIHWVEDVV